MTKEQKTIIELNRILGEFADGFLFIGFHPESKEPMTAVSVPNGQVEIALNSMMGGMLQVGGVRAVRDQIKRAAKKRKNGEDG